MNGPKQSKSVLADINIIPLVDVMLVLLIIFMITAPMMQQGLPIDLPKVTTKPLPSKDEIQTVTVTKERAVILNTKRVDIHDLKAAIELLFANKTNKEIFLKADSGGSLWFCGELHGHHTRSRGGEGQYSHQAPG